MKIILASASPRRSELLTLIGCGFSVELSEAEEIKDAESPEIIALTNAKNKARAVFSLHADEQEDLCVIGADTIVVNDDKVLGKPKDEAEAEAMLQSLSGKAHAVISGVCAIVRRENAVEETCFTDRTTVAVTPMTQAEIKAYAASDEPFDKAGAYGIQGGFARYIESISGDYYNVMGLPVGRLYREVLRNIES